MVDKSNLRQVIIDSPKQFEVGLSLAKNIKVEGHFGNVVISGMGGSAFAANLLRTYCDSLFTTHPNYKPFEIYINRYYSLPPQSHSAGSLNFISSYSGNTEETISALEEAHSAGLAFVGFSSGGRAEELCRKYSASHIKLPIPSANFQPRMATGYFFASMFQLLVNQDLIPDTTGELLSLAEKLNQHMGKHEEWGKKLASKLRGKTPVIYSSPKYKPVAMIWKIKINENAKTPAFWNFLPEANHNEMGGFTNSQGEFFLIMLRDPEDDPRNLRRYEATSSLLAQKGAESEIIEMHGADVLSKMFSSLNLADWTSYYLALEYSQDPTPVEMVESLKRMLAS